MKGFLRLAAGLAVLAAPIQAQCQALSYPAARKAEVVEQIFGVQVTDPYRWMEDARSKELVDWVAAQNALSSSYLRSLPLHGHFQKRITELWNYSKTQIPIVEAVACSTATTAGCSSVADLHACGERRAAQARPRSERHFA